MADNDFLVKELLAQRAMLLAYIGAIVLDDDLAEDVFQNMALVVLRKAETLTDAAGFPAWARRIARFEALNALRVRKRAPQALDDAVLDALDERWNASDVAPAEAHVALRECLEKLPARSRRLVDLRYRENVSGRDLAERLSRPVNTVYVGLSRIHRFLMECVTRRLAQPG